ncbi:1726_t:CDS:2 [Paraglomus brasilianum]|uniref:1726_t:CDS:1 n=1 Tax=Paraglomus brasilianum TaxID=144538 RepID=A0A9N9D298_9GLOM|nr:1726_t:CDS:2 [Paraglomus brasilianum]
MTLRESQNHVVYCFDRYKTVGIWRLELQDGETLQFSASEDDITLLR